MANSNVLGWVFPAPGEDTPPSESEVNFGPIHYKDSIIIQFTPASYTGEIRLYCDYDDTQQGNVWTLPENTGSPLTYHFNQTTPNAADPNDYHACHFFFASNGPSTSSGNTQAFQYLNNATGKAVLWSASGGATESSGGGGGSDTTSTTSTTSSSTSTSTSTSSTSTISTTSQSNTSSSSTSTSTSTTGTPTTLSSSTSTSSNTSSGTAAASTSTNTSAPDVQVSPQPSGLTGGAIAGIVIGILALIALIAGLGFFFGRRARRRDNSQGPTPLPPNNNENKPHPTYNNQMQQNQYMPAPLGQHPSWEGKDQQQPQQQLRMGELQGQAVNELDARMVHEIGGMHRTELP
ncbi:MAG: hypothetical protein GOMPHAMPRED_003099 [Gomphillus americanus]|uniref:Uncharacterized protein n=1 Tax=Gomphillus americanus TaxID=1940652 RepID=A0A8H3I5A7_9LECA|nr:MAG: hypothetical protein GOMPHAMPRED_003099 [Gomphillus americanus]